MTLEELKNLPKCYTVLLCTSCGRANGYVKIKHGLCDKCKVQLIEIERGDTND